MDLLATTAERGAIYCADSLGETRFGVHTTTGALTAYWIQTHQTSSHPNININALPDPDPEVYKADLFYIIASCTQREYEKCQFNTGIGKPSIFTQIPRILPLPTCFAGALMHQWLINSAALLIDLWCKCPAACDYNSTSDWPWAVLTRETWVWHGRDVAVATPYLPTLFGQPPRNPQEKISSSYKPWEFLYYIYSKGPGIFFKILQDIYYSHFCKLVWAIQIIFQNSILWDKLTTTSKLLLQWVLDFEILYCKWDPNWLHFACQCVHSLTYLAKETCQLGPLWLSSQWTMEQIIGYLGSLLQQPSNPFQNLASQTKQVAATNVLVAMWPNLEKKQECFQRVQRLGGWLSATGAQGHLSLSSPPLRTDSIGHFFPMSS